MLNATVATMYADVLQELLITAVYLLTAVARLSTATFYVMYLQARSDRLLHAPT
jgi:hypothetical protein